MDYWLLSDTFPRATVRDLTDSKQTIGKLPYQILLHIGTNDLKSCKPIAVVDSIVDLAEELDATCTVGAENGPFSLPWLRTR